MTPDQHQLAIDRARIEGRRMAHFPEKAEQDIANLRKIAGKVSGPDREYLNMLADRLEQTSG